MAKTQQRQWLVTVVEEQRVTRHKVFTATSEAAATAQAEAEAWTVSQGWELSDDGQRTTCGIEQVEEVNATSCTVRTDGGACQPFTDGGATCEFCGREL